MTHNEKVQDPLKPIDQILEADERQRLFNGSLNDNHRSLSDIALNDSVPLNVKQLFETAKNLSLYSWFVYRFHQVSEMVAFSALEMALRERYILENPIELSDKKRKVPTLYGLMQHAKKEQWIKNEGFPSLYARAKYLAEDKKAHHKMLTHDFDKEPSMSIDEPTEQEIQESLAELDMVSAVSDNAHKIRNNLAHGASTLHPGSVSRLYSTAEIINQIYP